METQRRFNQKENKTGKKSQLLPKSYFGGTGNRLGFKPDPELRTSRVQKDKNVPPCKDEVAIT